jgi:hypothetical protein
VSAEGRIAEFARRVCGWTANGEGHHPGDPDCRCAKIKGFIEYECRAAEAVARESVMRRMERQKEVAVAAANNEIDRLYAREHDLETSVASLRDRVEKLQACASHLQAILYLLPDGASKEPLDRICGAVMFTARMAHVFQESLDAARGE